MPVPTKQTKRRIKLAAQMQIEGATWAQIAPRIGRKTEITARGLTAEYPDLWREAVQTAREAYLCSVEAEALLTQRELTRAMKPMRDEKGNIMRNPDGSPMLEERDERIRQSAAHSLLAHSAKLHAQQINVTGGLDHNHFQSDGPMDWNAVEAKWAEEAAQRKAKTVESVIVNRLPPPGGNGGTH